LLSSKWKYLQDWFGFYPEWFVGGPVIILLLYGATLASLIPGSKEYLMWLSYTVSPLIIGISLSLIPVGYLFRSGKIAHNLRNVYWKHSLLQVVGSLNLGVN